MNLLEILAQIPDPEIPVINIVELGIVREARMTGEDEAEIIITPTYSACPAMYNIEEDIIKLFSGMGITAHVVTRISPVWTTDWITDEAREKLREYGIAPPQKGAGQDHLDVPKECPRCRSENTRMISRFGSTLCKASYQCNDCLEPFDYFKCH
ncbi:1,2-phenylacetyl-CoA epoxidase subunit PaaD [Chryseobacterium sp. MFBS3-17]|uniref:1,2-phenylacetyl-CoA epoxidase subunit PaaD n=1 Tax=Chryseobacterium sp. MFBS3-17 TaxID=2886689 RepID=UPI001D0E8606|nr:1,2-phenylacetyl-CoA epoxidase subunit PaaD [Chryseobacterium sp. MFBS3-17]MCC2589594.1 phenylacetate-CoA oxygenase subunit PaaJ [Chryseobacterium sp. MFBS3-17]